MAVKWQPFAHQNPKRKLIVFLHCSYIYFLLYKPLKNRQCFESVSNNVLFRKCWFQSYLYLLFLCFYLIRCSSAIVPPPPPKSIHRQDQQTFVHSLGLCMAPLKGTGCNFNDSNYYIWKEHWNGESGGIFLFFMALGTNQVTIWLLSYFRHFQVS